MSKEVFAHVFIGGKIKDNYEADATGATAHWPDTTHYKATVPAGKRWIFIEGVVKPDANATITGHILNDDDEVIAFLCSIGATTALQLYPTSGLKNWIPMKAGDYVQLTFGAAQGANAYASAIIVELDE